MWGFILALLHTHPISCSPQSLCQVPLPVPHSVGARACVCNKHARRSFLFPRFLKLPLADSHNIALGSGVVYGLDFTTGRSGEELTLAEVSWSRTPGGERPGPSLRGGGSGRRARLRQQLGGGLGLHHRRTWVSAPHAPLPCRQCCGLQTPFLQSGHADSAPAVF